VAGPRIAAGLTLTALACRNTIRRECGGPPFTAALAIRRSARSWSSTVEVVSVRNKVVSLVLMSVRSSGGALGTGTRRRSWRLQAGKSSQAYMPHVFIIMMENPLQPRFCTIRTPAISNRSPPPTGWPTNYFGVTHASLPNYPRRHERLRRGTPSATTRLNGPVEPREHRRPARGAAGISWKAYIGRPALSRLQGSSAD